MASRSFKSLAHKAKIEQLIKEGKLPQKVADEWGKALMPGTKLPERIGRKTNGKSGK